MSRVSRTPTANIDGGDFDVPSDLHGVALFGPPSATSNAQRKQAQQTAWKKIRAKSGLEPETWKAIDRAFTMGYRSPTANVGATANQQTLQFDEWEDRDDLVVEETTFRLTALDDLLNAGLVSDTSLARMISVYQKENKFAQGDVERSMDGRARSVEDRSVWEVAGVPLPISHFDFEISLREQQNSQNFGEDLETADARKAGRALREDLEDLVFNGWGPSITTSRGTFSVEGYTNATNRNTPTSNGSWSTAQNVIDDVRANLNALEQQGSNNNEGYMPEELGVWWYIPTARWGDVTRQSDPEGDGNMNLRARIERDFPWVDIRHAGALGSDETVFVIQDPDVVDVADAQAPTTQSWEIEGGFATKYKSFACQVPRVKDTRAGVSGISHMTGIS